MSSPIGLLARHRSAGAMVAGAVIGTLLAACTPAPSPDPVTRAPTNAPATAAPTVSPAPATVAPTPGAAFPRNPAAYVEGDPYVQALDPADFVTGIDHPFLPFVVGSKWVFDGAERVEVEVLAETKKVLGIDATVVRDRVLVDGELVEDTLDWYAQDRDGNVWYLGEETAEYENGEVVSTAGAWEAGVDGAQPGIIMLADPRVGDEYRQEFYAGEAEDIGAVTAVTGSITIPAGTFEGADVLVTEEWTPLEPDVRERKTYVRGLGVVETRVIEGGDEVTTLQSITTAALPPWVVVAVPVLRLGFRGRHRGAGDPRPGFPRPRARARSPRGPRP